MKKWSFGIDNDELIKLVLDGKKIATTSPYDESKIPIIGEESIITFSNDKEACIVKTKKYFVMKFNEMTKDLAKLEGEGDLSLEYWKNTHLNYFHSFNPDFNENSKIIFEIFELKNNLVEERLNLGKKIANLNLDLFENINNIYEINSGFNNTLFSINNKYVIKVCTKEKEEKSFENEYNFYNINKTYDFIPKLYKYDNSKKEIEYIYEIIEKVDGDTLYYHWYKMDELKRETTIHNLVNIIKKIHNKKVDKYDWCSKIKNDVLNNIKECKDYFDQEDYNSVIDSIKKYDIYLNDNIFSLIHNDLHFDNIIYKNGKLTLIDFNDSINAPIDFEFRIIYMCLEQPWRWADINMDPYQKPNDYKNIWNYIKKYYEELNNINYLEERMIIYKIWDTVRVLKKYHSKEIINDIIVNSKKLIKININQ